MSQDFNELPPKVRLVFLKGYMQALEDVADRTQEQACRIQARIEQIQAEISNVTGGDTKETGHAMEPA